jgi:hypothetical protein
MDVIPVSYEADTFIPCPGCGRTATANMACITCGTFVSPEPVSQTVTSWAEVNSATRPAGTLTWQQSVVALRARFPEDGDDG